MITLTPSCHLERTRRGVNTVDVIVEVAIAVILLAWWCRYSVVWCYFRLFDVVSMRFFDLFQCVCCGFDVILMGFNLLNVRFVLFQCFVML